MLSSLFKNIINRPLSNKNNSFFLKIHKESEIICFYLNESIKQFPKLFNEKFETLEEALNLLKEISLPNNYVCANIIKEVPGWTCTECSKYTDSIFCHDCYKRFKHVHKEHHLFFLPKSGGMCGCGEPEAMHKFCPQHSGPHIDQIQINEYISKVFQKDILEKLKLFFNTFFLKFSNYFALTEKCKSFCPEIFDKKFNNEEEENPDLFNEKKDIIFLKRNFCIIFQNLLHFLRLITENNLGMLYLIANYFLENHFKNNIIEDDYKTNHRCVKFDTKEIEIINKDEIHICQCPFFTLFLLNWRDNISHDENQKFLLTFTRNFPLKHAFGVIYFCFQNQILNNNNIYIINNRIQFILDYTTKMLAEKTNIIEETYDLFYECFSKYMKSPKAKDEYGVYKEEILQKLNSQVETLEIDCELFSMPITRKLMCDKTSLMKRIIDSLCLIHNEIEFKSIFPHPSFQEKGCSQNFINLELKLLGIIECINMFTQWDKIENVKDIFKYIINKIIHQDLEGVRQLNKNEYTFHLGLYRCFGYLINYFCFYYSIKNKCSIFNSIQFFIKNFFESENQMENFTEIIINDYFKFFGFISGIKNGFFNYYDSIHFYPAVYFIELKFLKIDVTLLKYLMVISPKNINFEDFIKKSNIEDTYLYFNKEFILNYNSKNRRKEKNKKNNSKITSDELIDILNNSYNIFPKSIDYGEDLQLIRSLQEQYNTQINSHIIQQYIEDNNINLNHSNRLNQFDLDLFNKIMYIRFLFELLIIIIKDDSSPFYNLMRFFKCTSSTQTKKELFEDVKKNKDALEDLENILKEQLIQEFAANGNLCNFNEIKDNIDKYLFNIFDEKYFIKSLDELTLNKKIGNKKLFYLKDSSFIYLDMSYYYSFKDKSKAQKYIFDFKKETVKSYNNYFYKPSKLTFDFFEKVFEKVLLNTHNLEIMIKIIEKLLLSEQGIKEEINIISIKNSLLPIILKYLSIFGSINTKSFIKFKIDKEEIINELTQILSDSILLEKNNKLIDIDLVENIKQVIEQLNRYKIINNNINGNLSKLKNYDYNSEYMEIFNNMKKNLNINNLESENENKKKKSLKNRLKNLVKNKNTSFLDKVKCNKDMFNEINNQENNKDINNNNEEEIMCFFCRNPIKLNTFEVPYGKGGYIFQDFFYKNSIKASIKSELLKIDKNINKDCLYEEFTQNSNNIKDLSKQLISCGHFFHLSCFNEKNSHHFSCPLCLKKQNLLIPPLIKFHDKYNFLKPYKIEQIINKIETEEEETDLEFNLFVDILNNFLSYHLESDNNKNYLEQLFPVFQSRFNYLENIFYFNSSNFHKQQQIEINQDLILSLRFITKGKSIDINEIINHILQELTSLIHGPKENDDIINNYENMYYIHSFEKILLYLSILLDYDEIKDLLLYLIYIILPYFSFWFYLRDLIMENNFYSLYEEKSKENININNLMKYFEKNNNKINEYFKFLLKKILIIKLLTDYKNKNEKIIESFNELSIENIFSMLNMDKFYKSLKKNNDNEINFINILEFSKILNFKDFLCGIIGNDYDFNTIFNLLVYNIRNNKSEKYLIRKELLVHFSPLKFEFVSLNKNIFDFIEKYLEKECINCSKKSRYFFICLICGNKICNTINCNQYSNHTMNCGGRYCIMIDMDNAKISITQNNGSKKDLSSLYINDEGIGPKENKIGKEFNLSKEKENIFFKNFICYDFN